MAAKLKLASKAIAEAIVHPKSESGFKIGSKWEWEHERNGEIIDRWVDHNIVTNEGLNALLDIMFHGSTQITTWYVELVKSNTAPAAGMTYATPTYTPSDDYDEATREEYVEAAASGQSITNSANKAEFTMDATVTIYGASLVGGGTGASTKIDAAGGGTLFCYSLFGSSKSVVDDDILRVTITIGAADA